MFCIGVLASVGRGFGFDCTSGESSPHGVAVLPERQIWHTSVQTGFMGVGVGEWMVSGFEVRVTVWPCRNVESGSRAQQSRRDELNADSTIADARFLPNPT